MIEKIGIFVLFLGPLVFFHELGHFFFARLFGVRVEVFSIGFGPKLFSFKKGDTQYAVSLIPLGGYVKMYGDDPFNKDAVPEEERKYSFNHKSKWARFWIVFGGPLANFILAYFLFFSLFLSGERVPEVKIGAVPNTSIVYNLGVRSGDVLTQINDKVITGPSDVALVATSDVDTVAVQRLGKRVELKINMKGEDFLKAFMKFPPFTLRRPIVSSTDGQMYYLSTSDQKVDWNFSLEEIALAQVKSLYMVKLSKEVDLSQKDLGPAKFESNPLNIEYTNNEEFYSALQQKGFYTIDMIVKSVSMKSPADRAGISANDIILALNGQRIYSFETLRTTLQKIDSNSVKVQTLKSNGDRREYELIPDKRVIEDQEVKLIGVYSNGAFNGVRFIDTPSKGFVNSFMMSFPKTWETMGKTLEGFGKLISGEVSVKNIGGPIAIGKVASDSFNTSLTYFFQLMALFSVHLGIINLFPIPVLDGGHIMFIFLEIVNRGPLSRRKMEIAQQMGLSVLLMLMIGAIFNDFSRFF